MSKLQAVGKAVGTAAVWVVREKMWDKHRETRICSAHHSISLACKEHRYNVLACGHFVNAVMDILAVLEGSVSVFEVG